MPKGNCEFKGVGRQYLEVFIVHVFLLSMVTLGIYSPWAWARLLRLRATHTRIDGKAMTFTGTGGQLLVLGLVNGLLTMVTLGIYWPWAVCRISEWKAQHTLVDGSPSSFAGRGVSLFLFCLIHFFILPALTLGLYGFYAMYRYYAWKQEHFRYGGARTSFGAGFWGLLKIYLIIAVILIGFPAAGALVNLPYTELLSALMCILVSPWLIAMFFAWETRGTIVGDEEGLKHFPPVRTRVLWVIVFILVVWFGLAGAAMLVKDRLGIPMPEVGNLGQFLDIQGEPSEKPGSVRGHVKRPALRPAQAPDKKPAPPAVSTTAPRAADPVKTPSPSKGGPDASLAPAWRTSFEEIPLSSDAYERELRELGAFIQKDAQNADAYYSRGCLHARMGELEKAEKDFTRAIEINNRYGDAFYNRGLVLARMDKPDLAIRDFDEAIELNPYVADVYCNRGSAYFQLGNLELAMKDYTKALEIKPGDPDLYYNRGLIHLVQGRKTEAKADFDKAAGLRDQSTSKSSEKAASREQAPK